MSRDRVLRIVIVVVLAALTVVVVGRAATARSTPPAGDSRPLAVFLGDSDTAGAGATSSRARWTTRVSGSMGWREVNLGRSSTGYATSSSSRICGHQICPPYGDLVDQVAALAPDVVVIAGGQSDWRAWQTDPSGTASDVDDLFDTMRDRLPRARIIVVSPVEPPGAAHAALVDELAEHVRLAAQDRRLTYIDLLDPNVLGKGADVADNRFDPDDSGHRAIAQRVEAALT